MSNFEIEKCAYELYIPYFRGVFSRDNLPQKGPHNKETAVINLDNTDGPGTHWVCYIKRDNYVIYYDSFGIQPPSELLHYLGPRVHIDYNYGQDQGVLQITCGYLCLLFLARNKDGSDIGKRW